MKIGDKHYRSVWVAEDGRTVQILDQTKLPFELEIIDLHTVTDAATSIRDMWVRGAPLIGAVAAYGVALAMKKDTSDENLQAAYDELIVTRPTAINLKWALDRICPALKEVNPAERLTAAYALAGEIADEDVQINNQIGENGLKIIREIAAKKKPGETINILTHCNAGWLATVDWGTALSPIYKAHDEGIKVHVWVDETRPRNQGGLTSFELGSHGVSHTLIADNAGGHLMQHGEVDLCIVGTDRTTARGDVCNKIGTYLKALAAKANGVPFYVALPSPTIDWTVWDGVKEIPIEQRDGTEQSHVYGIGPDGTRTWVDTAPKGTTCGNYAFDVTPAEYVTGLITERGVCEASPEGLKALFQEKDTVAAG
ncbi:S-methyl-5-thioribose-1-phosphate isomerase [Pseudovibrio sp. SPO723]|uniref:S-methyl-5-thioribose-1-phosphate isomerase n=1 Tax=Nesiotobacter zosterae TaxID=392721 RepID=UPI0029C117BD|nr:S-methyl-5-thioribose-1-phosphate isomerase [Pseudovibrio sp. SPO723]MDX5594577.1 S-methyl-5-thioribose-1-phosphate isomerase [Pseudovibrio sp. SPO723]